VVALLGFFQPGQVLLQLFLGGPGRAVHALQHLVAVIATPVGARHLHQLEVLELAGAGHVRATAQVFEVALAVKADVFVAGNAGDDLCLVVLTHALEVAHRFVTRQHTAHHLLVLVGEFGHALFDGGQVFGREGALVREVVVEAVLDHRPDGHLRLREQLLHGVGQQVSSGVADELQPLGVFRRDDGQWHVLLNHETGVHQLAIDLATQSRLGQTGADRCRDVGHRDRAGKAALGTIGERDVDHEGSGNEKRGLSRAEIPREEMSRRDLPASSGQWKTLLRSRCHNRDAFLALARWKVHDFPTKKPGETPGLLSPLPL